MARGLSVYRQADVAPATPSGWQVRADAESLYDQPLGSESAIRQFWSVPAIELGLPLFAEVCEYGFHHGIRWNGEQLQAVVAEVNQLEVYWASVGLSANTLSDLQERAQFVREAAAVAIGCNGWVVVT